MMTAPQHHNEQAHSIRLRRRGRNGSASSSGFSMYLAVVMIVISASWSYAQESSVRETRIVIDKTRQALDLHKRGKKIRSYKVCLGLEPGGPKRITGDLRTPEGEYFVCFKNTASKFHRFIGISYPGEQDAKTAFQSGLISSDTRDSILKKVKSGQAPPWDTALGGWVGIHGYPTDGYMKIWVLLLFPKPHNWTDGCIALWDYEVEELYSMVSVGTPVTIVP